MYYVHSTEYYSDLDIVFRRRIIARRMRDENPCFWCSEYVAEMEERLRLKFF